ncbi:iron-sulfur cluster carrier protein ApbC [Alteromonas sp. ASW11-36]|uniref:Iron-sulfur cluster carrier protein n=1 Tax=Alteromonas arenosi TaxID=3055817 RepID=A0ABT7SWG3_9ALTE|nr:iron-sulfur cluster carrier protein ApbC [Alteromonas sp. ASW11-36]MDM7860359.1 iron-sulfur cluster carrier protein ApbC [Alteromonas sp. ASW11-36]
MKLFGSKTPDLSAQIEALVTLLIEYFVVEPNKAQRWVKQHGDELEIGLPFAAKSQIAIIQDHLETEFKARFGDLSAPKVRVSIDIPIMHSAKTPITNVKNIIAIASGKGGVGKSATAVNLAFALQQEGARVGILDADIYGPSVPIMLGTQDENPVSADNKHMQPIVSHGVVSNSIGYLVPAENATVWRGPMASRALGQLINDTQWPVLDYMLVDMPPGTGDIQLTMSQQVPLTAAVVVTTPQDIALADATKGIAMFEKVDIPVLGLVENMSYFQCKKCGEREYIFSVDGGQRLADRHNVPLLGSLPLDIQIREHADNGNSLIIDQPDSPLTEAYLHAARTLSQQLAFSLDEHSEAHGVVKGDPIAIVTPS